MNYFFPIITVLNHFLLIAIELTYLLPITNNLLAKVKVVKQMQDCIKKRKFLIDLARRVTKTFSELPTNPKTIHLPPKTLKINKFILLKVEFLQQNIFLCP